MTASAILRRRANGAHRVIVAGDRIVDAFGRAVGVDDGDDRNPELVRFTHGDVFVIDVDDEDARRQPVHVLDAAETALELFLLAPDRAFLSS